jgi:uncharacterized protein YigA (DUF484 family)
MNIKDDVEFQEITKRNHEEHERIKQDRLTVAGRQRNAARERLKVVQAELNGAQSDLKAVERRVLNLKEDLEGAQHTLLVLIAAGEVAE